MQGYPDNNPKTVHGMKKPGLHAIPAVGLFTVAQAMAHGAGKYGLYNYREKHITASVYFNAMQRHTWLWWDGETYDGERARAAGMFDPKKYSGLPHLALTAACCMIAMDAESIGRLVDDRGPEGALAEYIRLFEDRGESPFLADVSLARATTVAPPAPIKQMFDRDDPEPIKNLFDRDDPYHVAAMLGETNPSGYR